MSETTKISWATHTFSPWIGCSKVHAGCANCYAEAMAGRLGVTWGPNGTRRRTANSTWKQVEKWNRAEEPFLSWSNHDRPRVFPSLCDPFEDWRGDIRDKDGVRLFVPRDGSELYVRETQGGSFAGVRPAKMADVRRDFFTLIDRCQNLDFLLLTKRPENVRQMWPGTVPVHDVHAGDRHEREIHRWRDNVWILYSASDQASYDAGAEHLYQCALLAPVLGLSLEPLLGPIDLWLAGTCPTSWGFGYRPTASLVSWVIVGGESGPSARPMQIEWLESIADQCEAASVPLFVKQDSGRKSGQQGKIPEHLWNRKDFPNVSSKP